MANDDSLMSQDEIERLFSQTKDPAAPAKAPSARSARRPRERQAARTTSPWPRTTLKNC